MTAWRNNLARRYAFHERYEERDSRVRTAHRRRSQFVGDYIDASNARAAMNQMEVGYGYLSESQRQERMVSNSTFSGSD